MDLNTHRWGDGDTRVLLIHGICGSGATWWEIAAGIPNATVVAPDLRGHGESPRAADYSAAGFAEDLGTGWDLVIGHSLGGLIAVHAAQDPSFARRLILLDPVLELEDEAAVTAAVVAEANGAVEVEPHWHPEHQRLKRVAARQADPEAVRLTMEHNSPWTHAHLLDTLAAPALVFLGPMCRSAPGATTRSVPGTGHSLHRDRPELVLESI